MRTLIPLLFIFIVFTGCRSKDGIPSDIIPKEKMEAILWDLMRADQYVGTYLTRDTSINRTTESLRLYQQIFSIHNITREEFQKSFSFYRASPQVFKVMMDSISRPELAAPTQMITPVVNPVGDTTVRSVLPVDTIGAKKAKPALVE